MITIDLVLCTCVFSNNRGNGKQLYYSYHCSKCLTYISKFESSETLYEVEMATIPISEMKNECGPQRLGHLCRSQTWLGVGLDVNPSSLAAL